MNRSHYNIRTNVSSNEWQSNNHIQSQSTLTSNLQKEHKEQNAGVKSSTLQNQKQTNKNVPRIKQLSSEHLRALKATFDTIIKEKFLSKANHEEQLFIYNQLRGVILGKRPDAQINLYGSSLFECCLKETNILDIDVQFNGTLPYDTLIELIHIVRNWDSCKQAFIIIDNEPLSIDVTMHNSNILIRLTSNNTRSMQLSQIIQTYIKFDQRVLLLLRLFRIFAKICNIDRPDQGTFHPIVFHFMVIHFLQQLDPPVLPCLHEYVFGIDKVPVLVNHDQYADFFRICDEYVGEWKSKNTTSFEKLFLQLLSYYVRRFHAKRFSIFIQTRMPFLKQSNQAGTRKLFCIDPTSIKRNLAYTMKANCMVTYFERTLETALNYFCRIPKYENQNENILIKQLVEIVHKSYKLFIERFSNRNDYWNNMQQEDIRQDYKKTFDAIENPISEPKLKLNDNNIIELLNEEGDGNNGREKIDEIIDDEEISTSQNELQSIDREGIVRETSDDEDYNETVEDEPASFRTLATHLDEKQKEILRKEYTQQVRLFNNIQSLSIDQNCFDKSCSLLDRESVILTNSNESDLSSNKVEQTVTLNMESLLVYPELFYFMQANNFDADKGAPLICTICNQKNHVKSACPDLFVPDIIPLPRAHWQWINVISYICQRVTNQCKPSNEDIQNRKQILEYLQNEFQKYYPSCHVHVYGSSSNGFGFRKSDLDICIALNDDNNEQANINVLEKLAQILQVNDHLFKNVELVRDARVPIIRSIHAQSGIEIDISLYNVLGIENTRLLKTYSEIDIRVSQLGYMVKYLAKTCDIADVKAGTLSSYAYILMLIHFLQQIRPSVLPVLQQLSDDPSKKNPMRECHKWNVYFYDDLSKLRQVWVNNDGVNMLSTGELWMEFLRYYTEIFDYKNNVVTIRQIEPLRRVEKGWFRQTIAIEDPFILTHNLADQLSLQKWALIRRIFIRARQQFSLQPRNLNIYHNDNLIQQHLFDVNVLCPEYVYKSFRSNKNQNKKFTSNMNRQENLQVLRPLMECYNNWNWQGTRPRHAITARNDVRQNRIITQSAPQ